MGLIYDASEDSEMERILSTLWFSEKSDSEPVYLNLESEFLREHHIDETALFNRLVTYVISLLDLGKPDNIFYSINKKLSIWKTGDKDNPPPVLSIVGLTILAAQNMHSDDEHHANAFYPRLADLIQRRVSKEQLNANYGDVVVMWESLHEWIESNHALGQSMISSLGAKARIGFSRSQAIITARDRQILGIIKTKIGESQFLQMTPRELLNELKIWSTGNDNAKFSMAFKKAMETGDAEILSFLISAFKTSSISKGGVLKLNSKRAQAELWYEFTSQEFSWVIPKKWKVENFVGTDQTGREIRVESCIIPEIWEVSNLPKVNEYTLKSKNIWTDGATFVEIPSRKYWIFRDASSNDAVISFRGSVEDYRFSLLIQRNVRKALFEESYFEALKVAVNENIISGWDFYADVPAGEEIMLKLDELSNGQTQQVEVDDGSSIVLENGILLKSKSGSKAYLQGYEPDLLVDATVGVYSLVLDDNMEQQGLKGSGLPLPISHFVSGTGNRSVQVPGVWSAEYQVASSEEAWGYSKIANDRSSVISFNTESKIMGYRGRYYFSISETGRIEDLSNVGQPIWLAVRQRETKSNEYKTDFQRFVIRIPTDCVWIVGLHEKRPPVTERVSKRNMTIEKRSVTGSADIWETFFDLIPSSGLDKLNAIIIMVKAYLRWN